MATPSYGLTECEFIQQTINKLGSRMSILRMTIATSGNQVVQEEASKQLRSDTNDYRLAKSNMNDQIAGLIAGAAINYPPRGSSNGHDQAVNQLQCLE